MKQFRLQVEIVGDNSVAWCKHSGIIEGEDAKAVWDGLMNPDPKSMSFSFTKPSGEIVFLPKALMDSAIVTVEEIVYEVG